MHFGEGVWGCLQSPAFCVSAVLRGIHGHVAPSAAGVAYLNCQEARMRLCALEVGWAAERGAAGWKRRVYNMVEDWNGGGTGAVVAQGRSKCTVIGNACGDTLGWLDELDELDSM